MTTAALTFSHSESATRSFFARVYGLMTVALLVTACTAAAVISVPQFLYILVTTPHLFAGLLLTEVGLVMSLKSYVTRMSTTTATTVFVAYAVLNGLTLSVIFLSYMAASITSTFLVTAGMFGTVCVYGYVTKHDLSTVGNLCLLGVVGLILASVANWMLASSTLYWLTTYAGVALFLGLTAYDAQKMKNLASFVDEEDAATHKFALIGALKLYLDFINLFLFLLSR